MTNEATGSQAGSGQGAAPAAPVSSPDGTTKRYSVNRNLCTAGSLVALTVAGKDQTFVVREDGTVDLPASVSPNDLLETVFPGVGKKKAS
jgi:hypothetical protein